MSKFERVDEKLNSLLSNSICVLIRYYWWFFIFKVSRDFIHYRL